jgi:RimJ/RimL family protein N-acetyltransferase
MRETVAEHVLARPQLPLSDGTICLRDWRDRDAKQVYEACQDLTIARFIPIPRPYRFGDALAYIERTRREWHDGTKAAFAIVADDDPELVLGAINLAVAGSTGNAAYWLASWARGCGAASRALRLLTAWAMHELGLGAVILEIDPGNLASQHVAEAAGYHRAGRLDINTQTGERNHLIYSKLALEAER